MRRAILLDVLALIALAALALAVWRLGWLSLFTVANEELTAGAAETVASLSGAALLAVYVAMAAVVLLWAAARWLIWRERGATS